MADAVTLVLAHPYGDKNPTDKVTVDEDTARQLVAGGIAEAAKPKTAASSSAPKKATAHHKPAAETKTPAKTDDSA